MNTKLLGDLRTALVNLKPGAGFDMHYFCKVKLPESPRLDCGTVCCAYGLGTTLPSWQAADLTLIDDYKLPCQAHEPQGHLYHYIPNSEAREILGLTEVQWDYLFQPGSYKKANITPLHVVDHIDVLIGY